MPEILKAGETIKKGSSFLDNILSAETFETLDTHAHTLDQVTKLMDKANVLLSNPVVGQMAKLASQMKIPGKDGPAVPVSAWNQPTMSELVGGATPAPRQALQPAVQPIAIQAPIPPNATPEQPSAAPSQQSDLHSQVKGEIDKLTESQLMDLLMKMSADPDVVSQVKEVMEKEDVIDSEVCEAEYSEENKD